MSIKYKEGCLDIFKSLLDKYKKYKHQDKQQKNMTEQAYEDYGIFIGIKTGMEILSEIIKYSIWRKAEEWEKMLTENKINSIEDLREISIILPNTERNLLFIYEKYPWTIDDLSPELFTIVSMENYELMIKLSKFNQLLYFNIFPEVGDTEPIIICKDNMIELWVNIDALVKKLMHHHIAIAKMSS
jgi:hypothetical protein